MTEQQMQVPEGWALSTLGFVCEKPQYGWTTKAVENGSVKLLRTTDITTGLIDWSSVPYCLAAPTELEKYLLKDGDIVVSRAGSVGVSYLITKPEQSVFASYLIRFKPLIDRKYVYFFLQSPFYWKAISEKSAGVAVQNVNATKLKEIQIPVAPETQQKQIVAKIEELFSHIDAGIESLKTAQEKLKQYRQSVLKAAVTGELTKEWREQNADNIEPSDQLLKRIQTERRQRWEQQKLAEFQAKGKPPKNDKWKEKYKELDDLGWDVLKNYPVLPQSWGYTKLGSMIDEPKYGTSKKCSYESKGVGVLRIPNIVHGEIDPADLKYAEFDEKEVNTYSLNGGDVLTIRSNGSVNLVGTCALVRNSDEDYLYAGYLIRLRPVKNSLNSSYLVLCMRSIVLRNQIELKAKSTSGVNNINSKELQDLIVPICPIEEQKEVVQIVEEKLSSADRLMKEIETKLTQAQQQKQTILASAFKGELV